MLERLACDRLAQPLNPRVGHHVVEIIVAQEFLQVECVYLVDYFTARLLGKDVHLLEQIEQRCQIETTEK